LSPLAKRQLLKEFAAFVEDRPDTPFLKEMGSSSLCLLRGESLSLKVKDQGQL